MRIGSPAPSTLSSPLIFALHTPHLTRPSVLGNLFLASWSRTTPTLVRSILQYQRTHLLGSSGIGPFGRNRRKGRGIKMQICERVPEDLLMPIFEQLQDQRDLYACSLVNRTFNRAVTPILYRSWDTRLVLDLPANDRFVRSHKVFRRSLRQWLGRSPHPDFPDHRPGSNIFGNSRTATIREARSSYRWVTSSTCMRLRY